MARSKNSSRVMPLLLLGMILSVHSAGAAENHIAPFWIANVKATYPQILSAEIGGTLLIINHESKSNVLQGPFLSYEPGLLGHKIHVGYGAATGRGFIQWFASGRLSASYLHSWSDDNGLTRDADYYGIELVGSYNLFLLSVGVYRNTDNRENLGSVGIGFGF